MTSFREYLDQNGITQTQAADELRERVPVIHRAYHGTTPSKRLIAKIRDWSSGAVTFDDWFPPGESAPDRDEQEDAGEAA